MPYRNNRGSDWPPTMPNLPPVLPADYSTGMDPWHSESSTSSTRLYTLLLATVAGAGVALATVLVCCVFRTYLLRLRRNRSHSSRSRPRPSSRRARPPPALAASSSSHSLSRLRDPAERAEILESILPPAVPWALHILGEEERDEERRKQQQQQQQQQRRQKQQDEEPSSQNGAPSSPSLPDRGKGKLMQLPSLQPSSLSGAPCGASGSSSSRGASPRLLKATRSSGLKRLPFDSATAQLWRKHWHEGSARKWSSDGVSVPTLDATVDHLLKAIGGVEALRAATCSSITLPGGNWQTDYVVIHPPPADPSTALSPERLRMCAAATCTLRMTALAETGGNPSLAAVPPPWTLDYVELKLEMLSSKGKGARGTGLAAADASALGSRTSTVAEEDGTPMAQSEAQSQCSSLSDDQSDIFEREAGDEDPATGSNRGNGESEASSAHHRRGSSGPLGSPGAAAERSRRGDLEMVEIEIRGSGDASSGGHQGRRQEEAASSGATRSSSPSRGPKSGSSPASEGKPKGGRDPWRRLKDLGRKDLAGSLHPRIYGPPAALTVRAKPSTRLSKLLLDDVSSLTGEGPLEAGTGTTVVLGTCGTHIGLLQPGILQGQRVGILRFKRETKKQLMRLCTLLEAAPHPCISSPVALCAVPGKEAALVPIANTYNLEEALFDVEKRDSSAAEPHQAPGSAPDSQQRPPLPWSARLAIAYDLVLGLHHLHNSMGAPLVHGSIHTSSVTVSAGLHASLASPGFLPASMTPAEKGIEHAGPENLRGPTSILPGLMPLVTDFAYLDPQYHKRGQFTPPADVFALGVVLLKLITALPAKGIVTVAKEAHRQDMLEDVLDPSAGEWPLAVAKGLMELALSCCERRHTRRCKLENGAIFKLQSLILDSFRLFLADRGIVSATEPPAAITYEPEWQRAYMQRYSWMRGGTSGDSSGSSSRAIAPQQQQQQQQQQQEEEEEGGEEASGAAAAGSDQPAASSASVHLPEAHVTLATRLQPEPGLAAPAELEQSEQPPSADSGRGTQSPAHEMS